MESVTAKIVSFAAVVLSGFYVLTVSQLVSFTHSQNISIYMKMKKRNMYFMT